MQQVVENKAEAPETSKGAIQPNQTPRSIAVVDTFNKSQLLARGQGLDLDGDSIPDCLHGDLTGILLAKSGLPIIPVSTDDSAEINQLRQLREDHNAQQKNIAAVNISYGQAPFTMADLRKITGDNSITLENLALKRDEIKDALYKQISTLSESVGLPEITGELIRNDGQKAFEIIANNGIERLAALPPEKDAQLLQLSQLTEALRLIQEIDKFANCNPPVPVYIAGGNDLQSGDQHRINLISLSESATVVGFKTGLKNSLFDAYESGELKVTALPDGVDLNGDLKPEKLYRELSAGWELESLYKDFIGKHEAEVTKAIPFETISNLAELVKSGYPREFMGTAILNEPHMEVGVYTLEEYATVTEMSPEQTNSFIESGATHLYFGPLKNPSNPEPERLIIPLRVKNGLIAFNNDDEGVHTINVLDGSSIAAPRHLLSSLKLPD